MRVKIVKAEVVLYRGAEEIRRFNAPKLTEDELRIATVKALEKMKEGK